MGFAKEGKERWALPKREDNGEGGV